MAALRRDRLSAGNGPQNLEGLCARCNRDRGAGHPAVGETNHRQQAKNRTNAWALLGHLIAYGPSQHGGESLSSAFRIERCVIEIRQVKALTSALYRPREPGDGRRTTRIMALLCTSTDKHRRQVAGNRGPSVAAIGRGIDLPAGRAEVDAALVQRVAPAIASRSTFT